MPTLSKILPRPNLHHPKILALYDHDLTIPREKLEAILALPPTTVMEDFQKIHAAAKANFD